MVDQTVFWQHLLGAQDAIAAPSKFATPGDLARALNPNTVQTQALDIIDAELVRLMETPDSRLMISMPPQEGKSTRVAKDFVVWALQRNPELRIVMGSYAQSLANRNGRAVRNMIDGNRELLGMSIARDNGSASEWQLAGHEGGMVSVGRGAGITGRPADLIVIDDPIKGRAEAKSALIRDVCWDWWTDELASRLSPGSKVVLIMTRWHEDDLAGRLQAYDAGSNWRVVNIPAQCIDPETDPLGRELDEFMVSARGRTQEQWEQRKATAGPVSWASLYQGSPAPADGDIFKREWIRYYTEPFDPTGWRFVQSWDLTFSGGKGSDYVVGQVWAKKGRLHRLVDQRRGKWSFTETLAHMKATRTDWPQANTVLVEAKANGNAVIDTLKREGFTGIVPITPREGKELRAEAITPLLAGGDIELPDRTLVDFTDGLVLEMVGFPNGKHDDQIDAMTQAITFLSPPNAPRANTTYSF